MPVAADFDPIPPKDLIRFLPNGTLVIAETFLVLAGVGPCP